MNGCTGVRFPAFGVTRANASFRRSHRKSVTERRSTALLIKTKSKDEERRVAVASPATYLHRAPRAMEGGRDAPAGTTDFPYVTRARERQAPHVISPVTCYRCGQPGHIKADCPARGSKKSPPDAPRTGAPEVVKINPVPPRRAPEEIADARVWADKIREHDPRMGENTCGMADDVIDTPFRRAQGYGRTHGCVLRRLATRQLEELAKERKAS